ncbi:MAG: hypothetical protein K5648_01490 [Erysipelotrichaceae bacterium]|nr:hypothetical protein [Erysipelotrichaceae bacterium]
MLPEEEKKLYVSADGDRENTDKDYTNTLASIDEYDLFDFISSAVFTAPVRSVS